MGEFAPLGPKVVYEATEKIRHISERLKILIVGNNLLSIIEKGTLSFKFEIGSTLKYNSWQG